MYIKMISILLLTLTFLYTYVLPLEPCFAAFGLSKLCSVLVKHCKMHLSSCKNVALWKNFVARPDSYNLNSSKSCVFRAHKKARLFCIDSPIFSHNLPKVMYGIKKFSRHLSTKLISLLTLEIFSIGKIKLRAN
jgi:hypothetical protein